MMKTLIYPILNLLTPIIGVKPLQKHTGVNTVFPFYHTIRNYAAVYLKNAYPVVSERQFEKDLDFLLKHFKPVSLADMKHLEPLKNSQPLFHLTFDDGLKECYEFIAPLLEKKGIPATFFVNPDFVDNKALFHRYKASAIIERIAGINATERAALKTVLGRGELISNLMHINFNTQYKLDQCARILDIDWDDYLHKHKPYMDLGQLKELLGKGFSIGAHTMSHPELYLLDPPRQLQQIRDSIQWVRETLPQPDDAFAFPFTDWGVQEETLEKIRREFPEVLLFGSAGIKKDDYMIHRIPMENRMFSGKRLVLLEYLYYYLKGFFSKNIRRRLR